MPRGIDLSLLKKSNDTVGGFNVAPGFIRAVKSLEGGDEMFAPVLGLTFTTVNGEQRKEVCIPLPMVLPLIMELAQFGLSHTDVGVQDVG